jgi:hypothetical protein
MEMSNHSIHNMCSAPYLHSAGRNRSETVGSRVLLHPALDVSSDVMAAEKDTTATE